MFYIGYYEDKTKGRCLKMMNLFKTIKNITKRDTREWYAAEMISPDGRPYRRGVKATSEYEAAGIIALNMPEGNRILRVVKGEL
jgi:hypothetical protein